MPVWPKLSLYNHLMFSVENLSFVTGEMWRLEDETEGGVTTGAVDLRPRSQSPFSHFRRRAAYLRKSMSADDNLDDSVFEPTQTEGRSLADPKVKLKRKFVSSSVF